MPDGGPDARTEAHPIRDDKAMTHGSLVGRCGHELVDSTHADTAIFVHKMRVSRQTSIVLLKLLAVMPSNNQT